MSKALLRRNANFLFEVFVSCWKGYDVSSSLIPVLRNLSLWWSSGLSLVRFVLVLRVLMMNVDMRFADG